MDAFRKLYHDVEGTTDNKHIGNNFRRPIQPLNERTVYRSYETLGLFCTFCLVTLISLIRTADTDATRLSSWVASVVCTEFTTGWRQSRRVWTNLPAAKSSCVGSLEPVYNFLCCWATCIKVGDKWRHNDAVVEKEKLSISIKIYVVKPLCSVSKLSTESVGSRRELVANSVHTTDATQLDSWVALASAVCIGLYVYVRITYF